MQQQTNVVFYKFRTLFAGILTIALFVSISALVTSIGAGTVLDTKTNPPKDTVDTSISENPNAVVTSAYKLAGGAQHVALSAGTALYGGSRSVTTLSSQSGKSIVHGSATAVHGVGTGTAFVASGIGHGVMFAVHTAGTASMFTIHMPGRIAETVTGGHTVSAIIQPAADKPVPIISSETSAAALAHLSAEQQQQIASWQAAQVVANRNLGGLAIAGDASHGGYPAQWDNVAQDSQLDNWGMYSRECVSYTAWKVYQTYGSMPYWGGVGNANQWVADARNAGIPTSSVPKVHSVAISMRGYYGHAMWVEKVSGDMIYVSQYNYDLHGHYSEMWLSASALTYIYFK